MLVIAPMTVCKDILEEHKGESVESGTHGKTQKLPKKIYQSVM